MILLLVLALQHQHDHDHAKMAGHHPKPVVCHTYATKGPFAGAKICK